MIRTGVLCVLLVTTTVCDAADEDVQFVATPLTKPNRFTPGIEGPACDRSGRLYAVNCERQGTVGKVNSSGDAQVFADLPGNSIGNGLRFDQQGNLYIADYVNHNILHLNIKQRRMTTFAHHDGMNQPNDLAITAKDVLFASDPNWERGTGQIWRIDRDGKVSLVAQEMGTTNGIEVSPDEKTLYVNESVQRNIWAFTITPKLELTNKRLVKQFPDYGFDGMRCDVDGNLYITRHGKGTVVKMSPQAEVLEEIDVLGMFPTNIAFGGPDGRIAYVTEVEHRRVVQFRVDRPGREWQLLQEDEERRTK